ncbi:MAG: alpha/beta hydrolase [Microgenomates group bacterium]
MQNEKIIKPLQLVAIVFIVIVGILFTRQQNTSDTQTVSSRASEPVKIRYRDILFTSIEEHKNIRYSKENGNSYTLDLFEPKEDVEKSRAAIIWIHGGGFVSGSKEIMYPYTDYFAKRGYVTVTVNYRLGTEQPVLHTSTALSDMINIPSVRNAQTDAQTALRWLRTNATTYRIDPNKIYVGGSSAGAVTALLVGYDYEHAPSTEYPGVSQTVAGTVSIAGTTDPGTMQTQDPPLIMFHGERDVTVPFTLAKQVSDKAISLAIPHEFNSYPNETHGLKDHQEEIMQKTAAFFLKHMGQQQITPPANEPTITTTPSAEMPDPTQIPPVQNNEKLTSFFQKHKDAVCSKNKELLYKIFGLFHFSKTEVDTAFISVCIN